MNFTDWSIWPLLTSKLSGSLPNCSAILGLGGVTASVSGGGLLSFLCAPTRITPAKLASKQAIPKTSTIRWRRDARGIGEIIFVLTLPARGREIRTETLRLIVIGAWAICGPFSLQS